MDPQAQSIDKTRKSADILKAELERKKQDLYKVYNPTNQDFQVILNAAISPEVWTIQAKSEEIVPYYVAEKYVEEMSQKIITNKADKTVIDENNKRKSLGLPTLDLHTEQPRLEGRTLKSLMSKRDQIVAILNRGLYKEFGIGGSKLNAIDRRQAREAFDPGDIFNEPVVAQQAPLQPEPVAPPIKEVVEEDDEEEVEEKDDNE